MDTNTDSTASTGINVGYWLGALAVVLFSILFLPRSYSECDDVGIAFLLEQGYHSPFISTYLSEALIRLYQWQANIPWYGLYHYAMLWLALGLSFLMLKWTVQNRWLRGLLLLGYATLALNFSCHITFTYTSILLCGLGLLFLISLAQSPKLPENAPFTAGTAGVLFALGWATRFESPVAMAALLPVVLYTTWKARSRFKQFLPLLLIFSLPFTACLLLEKVHSLATPAEKLHYGFLKSAGKLVGVRYTRSQNAVQLAQAGWSSNDLTLLKHFLFIDERKFSGAAIDQVAASAPNMIQDSAINLFKPAVFSKQANNFLKSVWYSQRNLSFLFLATVILAAVLARRSRERWFALGYGLFIFLTAFGMFYFIRFPERVGYPIFWVASLSVVTVSFQQIRSFRKPSIILATVTATLLLCVAMGSTFYQINKMNRKIAAYRKDHQYATALADQHLLFRSSNVIFSKWLDPLRNHNIKLTTLELGPGWLIFSPVFYDYIAKFGLTQGADVIPWMLDNPQGVLITQKQHIPMILQFIQETYHASVTPIIIGHLPQHSESLIYRLQSAKN